MTVAEWMSHPLVQTVIVPAIVAMATLALPKLLDRWKDRRQIDAQDSERLSLSEEKFRLTIMGELKACKEENAVVHKRLDEVNGLYNAAQRRINELEVKVETLQAEATALRAGTPIVFKKRGDLDAG